MSYHNRLQALQQKINGLRDALAKPAFIASLEKTYIVGSWKKDRDCLWNISKKKNIYDNPFMWPKIWQGNRDQIKDPTLFAKGGRLENSHRRFLDRLGEESRAKVLGEEASCYQVKSATELLLSYR